MARAKRKPKVQAKPAKQPSKATSADAAALFDAYWQTPDDLALLRVYADELDRLGDPRGAFIQTHLAEPQQPEACAALLKKHGGALVGPAREFLREYSFGENGLVAYARTEADKLIAGIDLIGRLSAHLILTVTSLKTVALAKQLAQIALDRIYFVDFTAITGTHGGTQLPDKVIREIGPAFRGVRRLALSCCGRAEQCFSPDGLRTFGAHLGKLEYLSFNYYSVGLAPAADYARVLAAIPSLRVVQSHDFAPADFAGSRVKLVHSERSPDAEAIDALLA